MPSSPTWRAAADMAIDTTLPPSAAPAPPAPPSDEAIEAAWSEPEGLIGFLSTVDHKRIGLRYIYTTFFFFFTAGLMALAMRGQLATPESHVLGPQVYNEL